MRQLFLLFFALTYTQVWAQTYSFIPGGVGEANPYTIYCNSGAKKGYVCVAKLKFTEKGSDKSVNTTVLCEGNAAKECPSAEDCYLQFKKNQAAKKIEIFLITGNNQSSENNQSIPATKSCDIVIKQTLTANSRLKVKCGEIEAFIEKNQPVDDFKFKYFTLSTKDYPLDLGLNAGNMVLALNGSPEPQFSKIRDVLKAKGVIFDKSVVTSEMILTFVYTPKSKDPMAQVQFYISPTGSSRFSICPSLPNQKCHMEADPIEIQTPYCDSAIIMGYRHCSEKRDTGSIGCFAKKNELFCVDAMKCGIDGYTNEHFSFEYPSKIKETSK